WTPPDESWVESPSSQVKIGQKIAAGSSLNPPWLIKIPLGSPSLVLGGKAPAKIGGVFPRGCVGFTQPQGSAFPQRVAQLGGVEITDNQIAKYRQKRTETKYIPLEQPIPVELRYETIVVEDGRLHIYRDIYERGTNTEENLRNTLSVYGVALENLSESERSQALAALDQMGRNARGGKVPAAAPALSADAASLSPSAKSPKLRKEGSARGKLTRQVKGEKELVIEVAALSGKGYSAPVELDTGKVEPQKSQATAQARKQRSQAINAKEVNK